MIPKGMYFLLGFLILTLVTELSLLLNKSGKDKGGEVPGSFFGSDSPESTPSTASKQDSSLFSEPGDSFLPSQLQIEKELVKDIEGGNPLQTGFLYFVFVSGALIVIGLAVRYIFES